MAVEYVYKGSTIAVSCPRCGSTNINIQNVDSSGQISRYICRSCGLQVTGPSTIYMQQAATTPTPRTNTSIGTPPVSEVYYAPETQMDVRYEAVDIMQPPSGAEQDDGGMSKSILNSNETIKDVTVADVGNTLRSAYHSSNVYSDLEIRDRLYTETFRFGLRDTYGAQGQGKEYLFFTKPDLHIFQLNTPFDNGGDIPSTAFSNSLVPGLANVPFWIELAQSRKNTTLLNLQASRDQSDPFNHLLQNMVKSTLDVPGLTSEAIETPTNMYGVGYSYRGSSEGADDNPTFSLEFKDTKYLDIYTYFKAYEEYETIKHHGLVRPPMHYIVNKIIHDQFSIYKFILADDMETILYYGKMYGVMPMSLPRDVFSNPTFDDGISYTIEFKAAFYEDMKPDILLDFNSLSQDLYNNQKYQINPYNAILDKSDMRTAKAAAVIKDTTSAAAKRSPLGYVYKLKWRGGRQI